MSCRSIGRMLASIAFFAVIVSPACAAAFTFSDGIAEECMTSDGPVIERYHAADDPAAPVGYIGFTHRDPHTGWVVDWNMLMLSSAPSYVHDFVFFHECAHATTGTFDEVRANCLGLIAMRAEGRAGRQIEARLALYHKRLGDMGPAYGQGSVFWARTVACANGT